MGKVDLGKGLGHTLRSLLPSAARKPHVESARLTEGLGVGAHPEDARAIEAVAELGYAAIVNLAEEGELGQRVTPNVEATWAHAFELEHHRVQVRLPLTDAHVDAFLETLDQASRPVFVHSTQGERAAALGGIALGLEQGLTGQELLERLDGAGLELQDAELRAALLRLMQQRSKA